MASATWACATAIALGACSSPSAPRARGHVVVAVTIDWEGAYFSPEGLDALDEVRATLGAAPLTHFMSAAYFTKDQVDPTAEKSIGQEVRPGDELAVHLHGWRSLAKASGIEPKLSPSFLTGTDKLLEFEDADIGFDVDLDAYSVPDLRAMLRTTRKLLADHTHLPVSSTFRAGGYLGTPKVLQALREEGFTADSSATDYRQLDERRGEPLPDRLAQIWPGVSLTSQPFIPPGGGQLIEMPIAAFADYASASEIVAAFELAHARFLTNPYRDVFVIVGFHQETGGDFAQRIVETFKTILARKPLADELSFVTVEQAARLARSELDAPGR